LALATYQSACERWPKAAITLRQGGTGDRRQPAAAALPGLTRASKGIADSAMRRFWAANCEPAPSCRSPARAAPLAPG
jgi:hypothetical protein